MYIAHTLQVHRLIKNLVTARKRENGDTIEKSIQSEVAFYNEADKRAFYKTYKGNNESHRIAHNTEK